tara:strand:- start:1860 stop:2111 length:252 start_codon:yes stop_codon:yes gene_type:complete
MNKETNTMNQTNFDRERNCFGATIQEIRTSIENSLTFKHIGYHSVAMSVMSDAQEEMERGNLENARQLINRAKWVLSTYQVRT